MLDQVKNCVEFGIILNAPPLNSGIAADLNRSWSDLHGINPLATTTRTIPPWPHSLLLECCIDELHKYMHTPIYSTRKLQGVTFFAEP